MIEFIKKQFAKINKSYADPDVIGVGNTQESKTLTNKEYQQFYFAEENISASIDIIVRAIISSGYRLKSRDEDDENSDRNIKIGYSLFMNMNDDDTFFDIVMDTAYDLLIFGNAYLEERKANNNLVEHYFKKVADKNVKISDLPKLPIRYFRQPARYMSPRWAGDVGKTEFLGYTREIGTNKKEFNKNQIILISYGYKDGVIASPPSEGIKNSAGASMKLTEYNGDFFDNNATPRLHIELGKISEEAFKKFGKKFEKDLKGQPHKNIITKGGVSINPLNISNKEMEFKALDDTMQQKIIAKYGVMPGMIGKNLTQLLQQFFIFKTLTATPFQKIIANRINKRIFYGTFNSLNLEFEFMPIDTVDKKGLADVDDKYLKNQVYTINEVRKMQGRSPVDWGDRPVIPFSDASLAELPANGKKNDEVDDDDDDEGEET